MRTGFIGLGAMGAPMARNLKKAGLLAAVWNRTVAKAQDLATELGCVAASSPVQLAKSLDAVVLCVSADRDVLDIVNQLAGALRRGALVIDCSTVSAETACQAAAKLREHGADFLDCPVSGGVEGARDATLAIMVGGEAAAFARAQPIFNALGKTVMHFGASGSGQAAKAKRAAVPLR